MQDPFLQFKNVKRRPRKNEERRSQAKGVERPEDALEEASTVRSKTRQGESDGPIISHLRQLTVSKRERRGYVDRTVMEEERGTDL